MAVIPFLVFIHCPLMFGPRITNVIWLPTISKYLTIWEDKTTLDLWEKWYGILQILWPSKPWWGQWEIKRAFSQETDNPKPQPNCSERDIGLYLMKIEETRMRSLIITIIYKVSNFLNMKIDFKILKAILKRITQVENIIIHQWHPMTKCHQC